MKATDKFRYLGINRRKQWILNKNTVSVVQNRVLEYKLVKAI
jgi:hypothetical protein